MTLIAEWSIQDFPPPLPNWRKLKMNYYEHKLMEIREQIDALSLRDDAAEQINMLKLERNQILKQLNGEEE